MNDVFDILYNISKKSTSSYKLNIESISVRDKFKLLMFSGWIH